MGLAGSGVMVHPFVSQIWSLLLELAPWLMLGLAAGGLLHVLVPGDLVRRKLGGGGLGSVFRAVAFGVPLPLCSCGVIPAALALRKDGASRGASLGFLISTPQTGVDSILVSGGLLGWPFAIFKVAAALVMGLVGGGLAEVVDRAGEAQPEAGAAALPPRAGARVRLIAALDYAIHELLASIWGWLVVGVLASAALSTWVRPGTLAELGLTQGGLGLLVVLVISLPLYVCATASVPIAAALVVAGFSPGAALVFLMAGPVSNLATLGAVGSAFGPRLLGLYLLVVAGFSLGAGWIFDTLVDPQQVSALVTELGEHDHGPVAVALTLLFVALMAWLALRDLRGRWAQLRARQVARGRGPDLELRVEGMTCEGCVQRVRRTLESQAGVETVQVELEPGRARLWGQGLDERMSLEALEGAGFPAHRTSP